MRVIIGNVQTPVNPLLRAVYFVVGVIVLAGALFFGAIVLAFVVGFIVIATAVAAVRFWWIRKKLEKAAAGATRSAAAAGRIIEGEFAEVREQTSARDEHEQR